MTGTHFRAGAIACALLASTAITTPALAQVSSPVFRQVDDNGVDLVRGDFIGSFVEGSIGSGEGALMLTRILPRQMSPWDGIRLEYVPGNGTFVDFGTRHDKFPGAESRGSTLTAVTGGYHYTTPDGTVIAFINNEPENGAAFSNLCRGAGTTTSCYLVPTSITSPNGEALTLAYEYWQRCDVLVPEEEMHCDFTPRLKKVTNSHGYSIEFSHTTGLGGGPNSQPPANFHQRTSAKFFNNAVSATVPRATISYAYPSAGVTELTDMDGRVWRFTSTSSSFAIRRPGAAANTTTYNLSSGVVTSVVREGITTSYNRAVAGSTITMTVTDAASQPTVVTSSASVGRPSSVKDPLNRTTNFQYDGSGRLTRTTLPEANYVQLTYDTRGNVTETRAVSKTPNTPADIVTTASYPATCANAKTCNKPEWTRDARLNQTDYTYDSTHGGVLTVTAPSPSGGPVRPQTRYSYTLTNGEYLLTGVSSCATGSAPSCVGTADEVKSTAVYDARGNLTSTSSGNGSGTLTASSTMAYDDMGNLLTIDGPLAGNADMVRYRYNAARELIGTVSADPDGAGPLKHRASRTTITNGLVTRQERGTVDSQSDAHWAAFDPTEMVDIGYDAGARPVTRKLSSDTGTAYALTQTSYDAVGRPECAATRMNPAVYGSLPASACLPGTEGSFGKDRIAKTVYNNAGEVTEQRVAVGVAGEEAVEASFVYTANGKLFTLKDAENNLTSYIYDGHDRLSETRFPSATKGAGTSNPADNEVLTYDATGNVTNRQLRDDQNIGFTYDNLNRVTDKNLPGSEPDVSYAYDLLGRLTSASQTGHALSFTYDALGRNLTQAGPQGTVTSEWDLAGRRIKLTYPGSGLYLDYDYLVTGEMAKIRENGATSGIGVLVTFGYDDLGRRSSLTFGNGASQAYAFDPVSRLASLTNNVVGNSNDLSQTFGYNPASQIVSQVRSNDQFAWNGHGSGSTASIANGLNQLASVSGAATVHDLRGNLTTDPVNLKSYTYSSENLLLTSTGGTSISLAYDPMMRLHQHTAGAAVARFAYDGLETIAEYDGANSLQRRYVHGPGVDEPLVQYKGSGTANRRFMHADERGSIVAISDGAGNLLTGNRYDEFGKPAATNSSAFQYTGQMWLGGLGLYYYRARMYAPHLGRFLQTDPAGGSNLYAYVGNDPVGFSDPSGMIREFTSEWSDDMSRFIDTAPQGSGFGSRSWDWMGGMGTSVSGRLDSQILTNASNAWFRLNRLSQQTGVNVGCLLACSNAVIAAIMQPAPNLQREHLLLAGGAGPGLDWFQLTDEAHAAILAKHGLQAAINFATGQSIAKGVLSPTLWDWEDMRNAISFVVLASPASPTSGGRSRYEAELPYFAGFSRNGLPTNWLTVITQPVVGLPGNNTVVTIYPGRQRD